MKLWLVSLTAGASYDEVNAFVIRAETEAAARETAAKNACDEGADVWRLAGLSTCVELTEEGAEGVVLCDFNAG